MATLASWRGPEKNVVYTAIFGGVDQLRPPPEPAKGWTYVCFTDMNVECEPWNVVRVDIGPDGDPTRSARSFKVLAHEALPDAALSLWIDGNMTHTESLDGLVADYLVHADLAVHTHPERNCTYDEAIAVIKQEKDAPETVVPQMVRFAQRGLEQEAGLVATAAILRRHTAALATFEDRWWHEIENGSHRDQLSIAIALKESGIEPALFDSDVWRGPLFSWRRHDGGR